MASLDGLQRSGTAGDRFLSWLGIHARSFRALLAVFVVMDLRSQFFGRATASKPTEAISPLFWIVGQYLILGGLVATVLFTRVDAWFFTFVCLSTSMAMIGTAIIVEFNEVVFDPGDINTLGHHPVFARTYSAARLANLVGYVLMMTAALNLFPAIIGLGLRDTTWVFPLVYLTVATIANLITVASIILVYALWFQAHPGDKARELLAWTQIILIMVAFYGGQAIFRDTQGRVEMVAYAPPPWLIYLPSSWLAFAVDSFRNGLLQAQWWILGIALLVMIGLWALVLRQLSQTFQHFSPGNAAWQRIELPPLTIPGRLGGQITSWLTRSRTERAVYWLCRTMLRRDQDLRMRIWPAMGMAVALFALGFLTNRLSCPFWVASREAAIPVMSLYLLAMPIPTIFTNLNYSQAYEAAWVFQTAPLQNPLAVAQGIRKAVMVQILLPVLLGMTLVLGILWQQPLYALLHGITGWLVVDAGCSAALLGVTRRLPFSMPLARGGILGRNVGMTAAINMAALFFGVAHMAALQSVPIFAGYLTLLVFVVIGLRWQVKRGFAGRFGHATAF